VISKRIDMDIVQVIVIAICISLPLFFFLVTIGNLKRDILLLRHQNELVLDTLQDILRSRLARESREATRGEEIEDEGEEEEEEEVWGEESISSNEEIKILRDVKEDEEVVVLGRRINLRKEKDEKTEENIHKET
jgi:hypothetical protein